MYDNLSSCELMRLQSMLCEGTEDAFRLASLQSVAKDWTDRYRQLHRDLAMLFIEAGTELIFRIDATRQPQPA
jgi:hypothetical protein